MLLQLDTFESQTPILKLALCFIAALAVTFSLFAFMQFLIKSPNRIVDAPKPIIDIALYQAREISEVKQKTKIQPPPKLTEPPKRVMEAPANVSSNAALTFAPNLNVSIGSMPSSGPSLMSQSGQASPIVRVPPKYPVGAARDGIEGWVELTFSIDKTGRVIDAQVIAAEPKRVFNTAALKALKRWKYKPSIDNGVAHIQTNQSVLLEFKLAQE
ncbi:energy transducer TonB [Pseudoalteromonas spongiae]|uniref:energy transducer TonB n=1 Tax=Pseudoalteromonas spongiae TaxID=298657 RepID=UPI0037356690